MSLCEARGGERRSRLRIEADASRGRTKPCSISASETATVRAAGAPDGGQDFAGSHGPCDRRAFRDRRTDFDWNEIVGSGHEARVERRAIFRLRGEQPGQTCDLAAAEKLAEADIAAQNVAARACGDDDVVGRVESRDPPKAHRPASSFPAGRTAASCGRRRRSSRPGAPRRRSLSCRVPGMSSISAP